MSDFLGQLNSNEDERLCSWGTEIESAAEAVANRVKSAL